MSRLLKSAVSGLVLTLALVLGVTSPAEACSVCGVVIGDDGAIVFWIFRYQVTPVGSRQAWLTIPDYETVGHLDGGRAAAMDACAIAQEPVAGISSVDWVGLYNSDSGDLLYDFRRAPDLDEQFGKLAMENGKPADKLVAFYTDDVPPEIVSGIRAHFNILVTLEDGFSAADLSTSLKGAVFATSAATRERTLHEHHATVFDADVVTTSFPAFGRNVNDPMQGVLEH